jgi:polysaccharide export outer membrane protein
VVNVTTIPEDGLEGLGEKDLAKLAEINEKRTKLKEDNQQIKEEIKGSTNYTVEEYLAFNPQANNPQAHDYLIGPYDVISIVVYEEPELSRDSIRVSGKGYISFPFLGRLKVEGLTTNEVENLIALKLVKGNYFLDAHLSVNVEEYNSKQYMILGAVNSGGTLPLSSKQRLLDALSKSGGIDFESGGKEALIIRTLNYGTPNERKIVIHIDLPSLLRGGDQLSNLLIFDRDLIYIPKAEQFFILGQVKKTGTFTYYDKDVTLLEAISRAGGFTEMAARNRTRILRMENGEQKLIEVRMDEITEGGKRGRDVKILPGDLIIVPERFF